MLKLININVSLGNSVQILNELTLDVKEGEFIAIIGENGAGKSTLFNVIAGSIIPENGLVLIDDEDVTRKPQHLRAPLISRVLQDPKAGTIEHMSINENMSFAYLRGLRRGLRPFNNQKRKQLFQEKLSMLSMGLENRLDDFVGNLSGGQRQALSLIMAIIADSKILLLDEITAALDPQAAETIMQIASKIVSEEKKTTLMITHNMNHAKMYGDKTMVLGDGKIRMQE